MMYRREAWHPVSVEGGIDRYKQRGCQTDGWADRNMERQADRCEVLLRHQKDEQTDGQSDGLREIWKDR